MKRAVEKRAKPRSQRKGKKVAGNVGGEGRLELMTVGENKGE